jgi:hypothetical protein
MLKLEYEQHALFLNDCMHNDFGMFAKQQLRVEMQILATLSKFAINPQ